MEPERLVFTFAWDRADGERGHETLVTVIFAEEQGGKTRMTFRQAAFEFVGHATGTRAAGTAPSIVLPSTWPNGEGPA